MSPRLDVVCFGEILWDIFEAGKRPRGEPIARLFRRELGGAPANVAVGLARLGVKSAVLGGIGRDAFGEGLALELEREGVSPELLVRLPNRTGLVFVSRDARGEPSFLFYRHETADMSVRAAQLHEPMLDASWALLGTSTLVHPELARATARFVQLAKRRNVALLVDLNVRAHLWKSRTAMRASIAKLLGHACLIKGSGPDLAALGGLGFLERHAPHATWLLTDASGTARALGSHGEVEVPAQKAKCVDATGAGDAFIAGSLAVLLAAKARPGSAAWKDAQVFAEALRVGHMLGAKAVSRAGAVSGLVSLGSAKAAIARVRRRFS